MDCYAWKVPEGCYASALGGEDRCPSATWFWIASAIAAGLVLMSGGKKRKSARTARAARPKRK